MTYRLLSDVKSFMTKELYGSSGEQVVIISERGNVMIVENDRGNRYPVKKENLTTEEVELKSVESLPVAQKKTQKPFKAKPEPSNTLF